MTKVSVALGLMCLAMGGSVAAQTPAPLAVSPDSGTTFVQVGRLLADPASGVVQRDKTLVITGNKVVEIRDGFVGEGHIVDLRDEFVLPGLIDSHVHLTGQQGSNSRLDEVTRSNADQAMIGAGYARKTLMAGFTTVADLGASNEAIFALRDAIRRGDVPGPRVIAAGSAVSIHGGHGDVNGFSDDVMHLLSPESVCSGADDCMRAVRLQVRSGADIIKITATGGVLSNTAAGLAQQFTDAELAAIVEAAHRMGRQVTAHAHGTDGINAFLRAGGDSIEHGTYLDDESIRLFHREGVWLVPTLLAGDFVYRIASGPNNFLTPAQTAKALEAGPEDARHGPPRPPGRGARSPSAPTPASRPTATTPGEFALLVRAGLDPAGGRPGGDGQRGRALSRISGEAGKPRGRQAGGPDRRGAGRPASAT
jgi:imidazolonepropionase-like amidohydrolase